MSSQLTTLNTERTDFVVDQTTNLSIFKSITGNREIDKRHVEKLQESMRVETLFSPLYLNEKMEVIDGQHRLEAKRKTLEEEDVLPGGAVEYIVLRGEHYGADELAMYNSATRVWSSQSFFHSYQELGNPNYLRAKEFVEYAKSAAGIPLATALDILGGWKAIEANKRGTLSVSEEQVEKGRELIERLLDFKNAGFYFYKLLTFVQAFKALSNQRGYDHDRMKGRMLLKKDRLIFRTKKMDFLADLQDMYR